MKRFASERVAGLMERLGLEDDVAIESRIVSKTIESAQTRVEGYNFDIRKRVVEFDDVINKQRETIYSERDKVLRNEDLTQTTAAFLDEEVDALVATYCSAEIPDDWNMEGLAAALHAMGLEGPGPSEDELWEMGGRAELTSHLRELCDAKLEEKSAEVGADDWSMIERLVRLRAQVQEVSRPLIDRPGRSAVRELALVGLAVVAGGILVTGYATIRIWQRGSVDEARPVDAIVVMGAAQYDGTPSAVFASRLDHAVRLYEDGLAPVLIVTGGGREGDRTTEAAAARAYAVCLLYTS